MVTSWLRNDLNFSAGKIESTLLVNTIHLYRCSGQLYSKPLNFERMGTHYIAGFNQIWTDHKSTENLEY